MGENPIEHSGDPGAPGTPTAPGTRQLIIDYIVRREGDTDYVTREGLARAIAGEFWSKIEKIAPDQRTLNIPQEVYDQWREVVRLRKDGKPRVDGGTGLLLPVRAFYLDIQSWALEEPERWARWAAPCPIPPADLRGGACRRRINERTADRVRERQPLLPALVAHVDERYAGLCPARGRSGHPAGRDVHPRRAYLLA